MKKNKIQKYISNTKISKLTEDNGINADYVFCDFGFVYNSFNLITGRFRF